MLEVIDAGHYEKTVATNKGKAQVCRQDGEEWPCAMILTARKQARANRGTTNTGSKV